MTTSFKPTSPAADIAAWQNLKRAASPHLLTPDLVALVQSGVAVSLGARDDRGWPAVGIGTGCRVLDDGRLRVLLGISANGELLAAVASQGMLSVTFSAARDHRSCQVKTSCATVHPAVSDDFPELDRQTVILRDELIALGIPSHVAHAYVAFEPGDIVAFEFLAEHVYTQTPGPGAGTELK